MQENKANKNPMTRKAESEALLQLKDIEQLKSSNAGNKIKNKGITLDDGLKKYNESYSKALDAPVPNITLHFNEVLVRAVPIEVKTRSGLILSADLNDISIAGRLNKLSHAVAEDQEILMVGDMIDQAEQDKGLRPGRMARLNFSRYRSLHDESSPGMIQHAYEIPVERIGDYKYIIVDKRDVKFTYDKED